MCENVRDQFRYTGWQPTTSDESPTLKFTLDGEHTIRTIVIYHGSSRSGDWRSNASEYTIQASTDGKTYRDVLHVTGNYDAVSVHEIPETTATYFRIVFKPTGYEVPLEVSNVKFLTQNLSAPDRVVRSGINV